MKIGVIGCSGAGKSTLAEAIKRYYGVLQEDITFVDPQDDKEQLLVDLGSQAEIIVDVTGVEDKVVSRVANLDNMLIESIRDTRIGSKAIYRSEEDSSTKCLLNGNGMSRLGSKKKRKPWE